MKSRKNILGLDHTLAPGDRSGQWDINDITNLRVHNEPVLQSSHQRLTDRWPEHETDPFRKEVLLHMQKPQWTSHIFSDRSSHNWHEYMESDTYYMAGRTWGHHRGPRYPHSTWFYDQYYTVTDYAGIQLGSSNFTLQFWVKLSRYDTSEHYLMGKGGQAARGSGSGWVVYITAAGNLGWYDAQGNSSTQCSTAMTRDTWYHVAIVRSTSTTNGLKIYLNGVLDATGTSTGNFTGTENMYIGRDRVATAASYFGGYLSDLRLTTTAEYSDTFTVPGLLDQSAANTVFSLSSKYPWHPTNPDLHPQGATITCSGQYLNRVDDNPFETGIQTGHGYSSVQCSNSTTNSNYRIEDNLKTGDTSLVFGTGPFTVEMWVRVNDYQRDTGYIGKGVGNQATAGTTGWSFGMDTSGYLYWIDEAAARLINTGTSTNAIAFQNWAHIAAVREGTGTNQFKMYVNGRIVYTGTVSTNYDDTAPLRIFTDRQPQYWAKHHDISCLKISKTARYTDHFTIDRTTFFDTMMTSDENTSLMTLTSADEPVRGFGDHWVNKGNERYGVYAKTDQVRSGQKPVFGPPGWSIYNESSNQGTLYARTTLGDFNFGTGDFSIEFWVSQQYSYDNVSVQRYLFDNRVYYNDSGITLRYNQMLGLDVVTGNATRLTDPTTHFRQNEWYHICIQRTNGKMALYVNGKKRSECAYNGTISAPGNDWFFMNGSYVNLRYTTYWHGYFSDLRIVKGSGAYSVNNTNPDKFRLPTATLEVTPDGNTVLLTAGRKTLKDDSGRDNFVWAGNRDEANFTSSYNTYMTNDSPYHKNEPYDYDDYMYADNSDVNGGWYLQPDTINANGVRRQMEWIQHMSIPWTIEFWVYLHNTNPASITNQTYLYNASGNSQDGIQIMHHYAGNANSYNDWTLIMRNNKYPTAPQWINTSSGNSNAKPHSWNHVAFVYDPTKTSKVAIHCNGKRVATRAAFTYGDRTTTYQQFFTNQVDPSNVRISKSARYDNDSTTYTVPTGPWTYDSDTAILIKGERSNPDSAERFMRHWHGTAQPSTYSKWGEGSLLIPNLTSKNTTAYDGIHWPIYSYWADKSFDIRWGDVTFEGWASWWDAGSGGKAFNTTAPGSCLLHWTNTIWLGLDTAGSWKLEWANTSTVYNTINSGVTCAVRTDNAWDHFAVVRHKGDWYLYINGQYYGNLIGSDWGTYASNGPTTSFASDFYNINAFTLGKEYDNIFASSWTGFLEDFRITRAARYWVRSINGVQTMCHIGTDIPALPTGLYPTR